MESIKEREHQIPIEKAGKKNNSSRRRTAMAMANTKSSRVVEIPEDEEDVEFLYQLEAAEAHALSLSSSSSAKRRRLSVEESNNSVEQVEEGAYTAALKGSKSLTWQKQQQQQQQQNYTTKKASDSPTIAGGGGCCFKCGKEGHWARECPTSSAAVVGPTYPPLTTMNGVEKLCACGLGNCLLFTANTERNRGRKFFRCPVRQENGGCGFFEWCDETSGNCSSAEGERAWKNGGQQQSYQRSNNQYSSQAASAYTKSWNDFDKGTGAPNSSYGQKFETTENKGYSMKSDSSCFKCGQLGHWARDCVTTSSNVTAGGRTSSNVTADSRGNQSSNACFKCGMSGHWARDCSEGQSTKLRTW
ncbi:DNA topoisomerase 3-alpha [Bienertia sinuspersici]